MICGTHDYDHCWHGGYPIKNHAYWKEGQKCCRCGIIGVGQSAPVNKPDHGLMPSPDEFIERIKRGVCALCEDPLEHPHLTDYCSAECLRTYAKMLSASMKKDLTGSPGPTGPTGVDLSPRGFTAPCGQSQGEIVQAAYEAWQIKGLLVKLLRHQMGPWFKAPEPDCLVSLEALKDGVEELIECTLSIPECMPIWKQVVRNEVIEECAQELDQSGAGQGAALRALKKPVQTHHL